MLANDWVRTADLWCRMQPLYQLSHNHCQLSVLSFLFLYLSLSLLFFQSISISFSLSFHISISLSLHFYIIVFISLSLSLILTSKHVHRLNRHQTSLLQFCLENVFLLLRDDADLSKSLSAVNNILSISIFNPFFLYRSRSYFKPLMIMHSTLVFSAMS